MWSRFACTRALRGQNGTHVVAVLIGTQARRCQWSSVGGRLIRPRPMVREAPTERALLEQSSDLCVPDPPARRVGAMSSDHEKRRTAIGAHSGGQMAEPVTHTIEVPGAVLRYDVR